MSSRTLAHPFGARSGRTVRPNVAWPRVQAYLRQHGAYLFTLLAVAGLATSAVFWVTGARGVWLGFLIGGFIATLSCSIAWLVSEASGARSAYVGAVGEEWSADALKGLSKRWACIDHTLLSDAGVFAVETKFTASEWSLSSPPLHEAMRDARWSARKVKLLLDQVGRPSVTPVLIVWGPGAPALPGGSAILDGVVICRGSSAKEWRSYFEGLEPTLDASSVSTYTKAVREQRTSDPQYT